MATGSAKWHGCHYTSHGNIETSEKGKRCKIIGMNPSCHVSHTCKALARFRNTLKGTSSDQQETVLQGIQGFNSQVFGQVIEKDRCAPSTLVIRVPWGESWQDSYVTVTMAYTEILCWTAAC